MVAAHAGRPGEDVSAVSSEHRGIAGPLQVPSRMLMGPGPSNAHPRVLAAQTLPLLGHMHPSFFKIMDEIQGGLRYLFQTSSPYTLCISGTGHAGMEAVIANLLEPGDKILVGNNGIWGERVSDMAARFRAEVVQLRAPAGRTFSTAELKAALTQHRPAVLFLVQGESSTGAHQARARARGALGDGLGEACRAAGTLLVVDAVASLGGVPFLGDEWGVDAAYTGSQKCLSAPPGAAPLFLGERALAKLRGRASKPATYNLDLNLIGDYWGCTFFLMGPSKQFSNMTSGGRWAASLVYVGAIVATLVIAFTVKGIPGGVLVIVMIVLQFIAALWYCATYVPGGPELLAKCFGIKT
ncbi:alanine-glyoxylate transaminase [Raphidocelis subcapitata]|uniref:alanine--glyoxylate transaminase n=1 Tax=Raphidocelis subcapitata TaxID=307507 RepID=A0A2V0PK84_9CHLO|nr:alanine-glyoxylate transaminase [Raphidocelis subcapitata]|eukprot:GBF98320.1 alanine-glyoxylate transaminase [Raphidocelis subcapitata]